MLFKGIRGGRGAGKATRAEKEPLLKPGAQRSEVPEPPTKATAEKSGSFGEYAGRTLEGVSKYTTIAALVFTGLYFLPPLLTKQMADTFFPCLPEEYRPFASGACSCSCCICTVCILVVVLLSMASDE